MKALLLAVSLVFASNTALAQPSQPPDAPSHSTAQNTRYQLLAATVTGVEGDQKYVFMIDTATGRVWQFQSLVDTKDSAGKPLSVPPLFIPIRVMPNPLKLSNNQVK